MDLSKGYIKIHSVRALYKWLDGLEEADYSALNEKFEGNFKFHHDTRILRYLPVLPQTYDVNWRFAPYAADSIGRCKFVLQLRRDFDNILSWLEAIGAEGRRALDNTVAPDVGYPHEPGSEHKIDTSQYICDFYLNFRGKRHMSR